MKNRNGLLLVVLISLCLGGGFAVGRAAPCVVEITQDVMDQYCPECDECVFTDEAIALMEMRECPECQECSEPVECPELDCDELENIHDLTSKAYRVPSIV